MVADNVLIVPPGPTHDAVTDWLLTREHAAEIACRDLHGPQGDAAGSPACARVRQAVRDVAVWLASSRIDCASLWACWEYYADALRRCTPGVITAVDRTHPEPPAAGSGAYRASIRAHLAAVEDTLAAHLPPDHSKP